MIARSREARINPAGTSSICIGVDAMGGDHGPVVAVEAVVLAIGEDADVRVRLFGDASVLEPAVAAQDAQIRQRIEITSTPEIVPMDSSPAQALRRGAGTSMSESLAALARREIDALVSPGNTGALVALSRSTLGMLPGIERPALMTAFPIRERRIWVLDLGANINVNAERLLEFAILGSAAVSVLIGREPRVALLNIGREASKGPDVIREAARLIEARALSYVGFVEGHDVFEGAADVVVCDGFAGNIFLKSAEGATAMLLESLQSDLRRSPLGRLALGRLDKAAMRFHPGQHNGASMLGINGILVKSHAHAGPQAFARAIALSVLEVRRRVLPELERRLWAMD